MAARRLLILLVLLLVVSTLAATLVPPQAQREETTTETERTTGARAGGGERRPGERLTRTVDASARGVERIELRLGDQLALTVRSGTADQVEIPALGRLEDVDPDAPARFDLLPPRTGIFEVRLLDAPRPVARIRVRNARTR
jgi:hypothetical protein